MDRFFLTEAVSEELLAREARELPMPGTSARSFEGFRLMWAAFDFLIICGKWSKSEIVALAIESAERGGLPARWLHPKAATGTGPVSIREIEMLKAHRLDPLPLQPTSRRSAADPQALDVDLHNVVAALYCNLQDALG